MSARRRLRIASPAKINPRLELLGRRPDGRHELWTTLLALDLGDVVELELGDERGHALTLSGPALTPDVPGDERNLALRAARLVIELVLGDADARGVRVHVEKHVPSRAGLGGGSSNAAAAALGTCTLLGADPEAPELLARLGSLGADVPFFLAARRTGFGLGTGAGERVRELERPGTERAFALLTPRFGCATADVYGAVRSEELRGAPSGAAPAAWLGGDLEGARAHFENDLEAPALRAHPELRLLRRALDDGTGGHLRLSGSGSSCFGIFADPAAAEAFLGEPAISRMSRDHGLRLARVARPAGHGVRVLGS